MRASLIVLLLAACTGEPEVTPPEPAPAVVAPAPAPGDDANLSAVVDIDAPDGAAVAGSPVLAASYAAVVEALGKPEPASERVARVAALRAKAMTDVPAEDASGTALREAYDAAVADALEGFFLGYAHHIIGSDMPSTEKLDRLGALEEALMSSGWDWDLHRRDMVQAKLMMALRAAG